MRLIVGPLPAAVYWRRRAIVLGVLLIALLMVTYACATAGGSGAGLSGTGSPSPSAPAATVPNAGAGAPTGVIAPANGATASPPAGSPAPTDGSLCTDDETTITARAARTTLPAGAEVTFTLLVKNTSNRTCTVDVGPDQQELRLVRGTEKIWSSDDCGAPRGNKLQVFPSAQENSYTVAWNGRSSSACAKSSIRTPEGPVPPPGEYTLIARVGTDQSAPITLTLS
jgi:hypothetical protein